jgi:hypothetical protein
MKFENGTILNLHNLRERLEEAALASPNPLWEDLKTLVAFVEAKRFHPGDTVRYTGVKGERPVWEIGNVHIIATVEVNGGGIDISTNRGAWFSPEEFELVAVATNESLAQVSKELEDGDDDEDAE